MAESRNPKADPSTTMQIEVLLDETMVLAQAQGTGSEARAPRPAAGSSAPPLRPSSAPPPRASVRPDIPRIYVEQDDADAQTTIFRDPLEEAQLEALKRKLREE